MSRSRPIQSRIVVTALAKTNLTSSQKSSRISDHYPLWVEFEVP
jgi:endonuclease/exonuclease/phosphatase family metal-dependent hydrolase